jgi:predicted transcriptional regulator
MSKTAVITARIDNDTLARLEKLADAQERSRAWLVNKAVSKFVEEETAFLAFVQEGEDAINQGDFYSQDEMESWFAERVRQRTAN